MAPTAGLAPAKTDLKDLSRDDFAFVGIENGGTPRAEFPGVGTRQTAEGSPQGKPAVWRWANQLLLMPHDGGTISLAPSPGSLVRLTFHDEVALPEGLSPPASAFEARRSIL